MRLLLAAVVCAGCINGPLRHFRKIDDGLYAGSQPSANELQGLLAQYHFRTVIKLDPDWQGRDKLPQGVSLLKIVIPALATPERQSVERILDALDHAPRPIYLHCRTGADRTGLIVALYRLRHGATIESVKEEMAANHFVGYPGLEQIWNEMVKAPRPASPTAP